jgi:hypothetical protein
MKDLIESVRRSIQNKNWYGALTLTLILPDISGKIEYPGDSSGERYSRWFDKYVKLRYTSEVGATHQINVFLNGSDCYALRCSYLHEGISDISFQRSRDVLDDFQFVVPPEGWMIHCNKSNNKLQLQVDIFCTEIIDSIEIWLNDIEDDKVKMVEINNLLKITIITQAAPNIN